MTNHSHDDGSAATRRQFLVLGAAGAVAGLVAACSGSSNMNGVGAAGPTDSGGPVPPEAGTNATTAGASGTSGPLAGKPAAGSGTASGGRSAGGSAGSSAVGGRAGGAAGSGMQAGAGGTGGVGGMPAMMPTSGTGENSGASCTLPAIPAFAAMPAIPKLPDPFKLMDGTRISRKDQWPCLRAQLSALAQASVYGPKPPKPMVTAAMSGNMIKVMCTEGGKSVSFSCNVSLPNSGTAPYPVMIACGASSLPNLSNMGIASITLPISDIAAEVKPTGGAATPKGLFWDLYGTSHKAGCLMAWAWGLSRLIDALELTPAAKIDPKRIAVTGCSRWGKGALALGAFDERVALTIPQESGSGGASAWRIADAEKKSGANIQEAGEIITEVNWQGPDFRQYAQGQVAKLPVDQHTVMALCAPRGLLVIENDIDWLGPVATYGGAAAARTVYQALGVPNLCGISLSDAHNHCAFPASQMAELTAFVNHFLLGKDPPTAVDKTTRGIQLEMAKWVDWTVPTLT